MYVRAVYNAIHCVLCQGAVFGVLLSGHQTARYCRSTKIVVRNSIIWLYVLYTSNSVSYVFLLGCINP